MPRRLALQGSVWTVAGYAVANVLRLGGNLVLTRLLFPEAFGLMAVVNVLLQGLAMFSDIGIGPGIIQNKRGDDPDFLNTAFTIQALRGVALSLCAVILAWPVSWFYGNPDLLMLVPAAGLTALIGGLNSTKIFTCSRHLRLGRLMALETATYAFGLLVMIALAALRPSVWALVIGGTAGTLAKTVGSHLLERGRADRLAWEPEATRALFTFGRWIFVSSVISFAAAQADRLLLGKLISLQLLGVYTVGCFLASSVVQVHGELSRRVLFPILSRKVAEQQDPRFGLLLFKGTVAPMFLFTITLIGGFAPVLVDVLYDDRYAAAGWILEIFCVGRIVNIVSAPTSLAMLAQGEPKGPALGSLAEAVALVAGMLGSYALGGETGAITAAAFTGVAALCVQWSIAPRYGLQTFGRDCVLILGGYVSSTVFYVTRSAVSTWTPLAALPALFAASAAVAAFWATIVWRMNPEFVRGLRRAYSSARAGPWAGSQ